MKKAFTIVEMLAIIVIMGVILAVILPNMIGISDKQKQNEYDKLINKIYLSAETYAVSELNNEEYPIKIKLQELVDEGYISNNLTNPLTEESLDYEEYILITKEIDNTLLFNYPDETDIEDPKIVFSPNGSLKYINSTNVTVSVSDDIEFNETSLKYLWKTNTEVPVETDFLTSFTNGTSIPTPSGANGKYYLFILVKDMLGTNIIKHSNPFNLDNVAPTIAFVTNGSTPYVKTASTVVNVSDNLKVNENSLKYKWTTSTTAPDEAEFTQSFINGNTVSSPNGLTGNYYLWIFAKDEAGVISTIKSNVFNIDGTAPVIVMNGTTPITIKVGDTYSDAGASATDNIDTTVTVTSTSTVVTTTAATYTVTYNAIDTAGNNAISVVRTVIVRNPVIVRFTTVGSSGWIVPTDVYSINVILVGGGGGGAASTSAGRSGGGGGGLRKITNLTVTPGETLTITVGAGGNVGNTYGVAGTDSILKRGGTILVYAGGGAGGNYVYGAPGGTGSTIVGNISGGNGGNGGTSTTTYTGGGGGAGGYTGPGGSGGYSWTVGIGGQGGGAGGGGSGNNSYAAGGGGGVELNGIGANGNGGPQATGGQAGSGGISASGATGGSFGGGGGGAKYAPGLGAQGAVAIYY